MQILVPGKRRHASVADKRDISVETKSVHKLTKFAEVAEALGTLRLKIPRGISMVLLNQGPRLVGAKEVVDMDVHMDMGGHPR